MKNLIVFVLLISTFHSAFSAEYHELKTLELLQKAFRGKFQQYTKHQKQRAERGEDLYIDSQLQILLNLMNKLLERPSRYKYKQSENEKKWQEYYKKWQQLYSELQQYESDNLMEKWKKEAELLELVRQNKPSLDLIYLITDDMNNINWTLHHIETQNENKMRKQQESLGQFLELYDEFKEIRKQLHPELQSKCDEVSIWATKRLKHFSPLFKRPQFAMPKPNSKYG